MRIAVLASVYRWLRFLWHSIFGIVFRICTVWALSFGLGVLPSVSALTYPSNTPSGEVEWGYFHRNFTNLFTPACPPWQAIIGFQFPNQNLLHPNTGKPLCAPLSSAASSLTWSLLWQDGRIPMWGSGGTLFTGSVIFQKNTNIGINIAHPVPALHINKPTDYSANVFLLGDTRSGEKGIRLHYNNDPSSGRYENAVLDTRARLFALRGVAPSVGWDASIERFTIDLTNGNVGIGTQNPQSKFHILDHKNHVGWEYLFNGSRHADPAYTIWNRDTNAPIQANYLTEWVWAWYAVSMTDTPQGFVWSAWPNATTSPITDINHAQRTDLMALSPQWWLRIGKNPITNPRYNTTTDQPKAHLDVHWDALINGHHIGRWGGNRADNIIFWPYTFRNNTTGHGNIAVWDHSLMSNTIGSHNTALWSETLTSNIAWNSNVAVWDRSLYAQINWDGNVGVGVSTLTKLANGTFNTAIGNHALVNFVSGRGNVALWFRAAANLMNGNGNIIIGDNVWALSASGSNQLNIGNWIYGSGGNIGIGVNNPSEKLEVDGNISVGKYQNVYDTSAPSVWAQLFFEGAPYNSDKLAIYRYNRGYDASDLRVHIGDNGQGAIHHGMADRFQIWSSHDGNGSKTNTNFIPGFTFYPQGRLGIKTETPQAALDVHWDAIINGHHIGRWGGNNQSNIALWEGTFQNNVWGFANTALGHRAMEQHRLGDSNIAIGLSAMNRYVNTYENVAVGVDALKHTTGWRDNTAIGTNVFEHMQNGYRNVWLGINAGTGLVSGQNNIFIGAHTRPLSPTGSHQLNIGNWIYGNNGNIGIAMQPWQAVSQTSQTSDRHLDVSGRVRAKEFCFHGTNECVSTFQQSQSNNRIFTLSNQAGIAHQDIGFTTPYTDNTKPMYINFTPQVIQQIGLEDPYTTKWVTIANDIGLQPHHPAAKQIWLESINTMTPYADYELDITGSGVVYPHPSNHPQYVLKSCYYTDANGVKNRYSTDYAFCSWGGNSGGNTITRVRICNKNKWCGATRIEYRITSSENLGWNGATDGVECQNANIPYGPILSVSHSAGSALSHSIVDASIYHSPPSVYSPVKCGYSDMRSAIQMRLVVKEHNGTRGSLMQIAQTRWGLRNRINKVGVMLLQ